MDELLGKKVDETFEDLQHGCDASAVERVRVDEHVRRMEVDGVEVRIHVRKGRVGEETVDRNGRRTKGRGGIGVAIGLAWRWLSTE